MREDQLEVEDDAISHLARRLGSQQLDGSLHSRKHGCVVGLKLVLLNLT